MAEKDLELQNQLAEIRKEEHQKEIALMKEKIRKDRENASQIAAEEIAKGRVKRRDDKGNEITLWDDAMSKADEALKAEQLTYQDWRAAMFVLLSMSAALAEALTQSRKENIDGPLIDMIMHGVVYKVYDKIEDAFSKAPEEILPELQYLVESNESNEIVIHPLERSDGINLNGKLDGTFEKGVQLWLSELGYTPTNANPKQYEDQNGHLLDTETFNTLKNDQSHGLHAFLTDHFEVPLKPATFSKS